MATFSLELCVQGHSESILYRIPKGSTLRFIQSNKLAAHGGVVDLLFNQAPSSDHKFNRQDLRSLDPPSGTVLSSSEWQREVKLHTAGSYQYRFTYRKNVGDNDKSNLTEQTGFIVVEPQLQFADGNILDLDAITLQTVMAPILGNLSGWRDRLCVAKESGYNMIHYSPIQELGCSGSAYSIAEQLHLLNESRDEPLGAGERPARLITQSSVGRLSAEMSIDVGFKEVHTLMKELHKDWGMFGMIDIVWNHTASDASWLRTHPEAGYNLKNSPHLKPAYELNRALMVFSSEVARGQYREHGINEYVRSEDNIRRMAKVLHGVLLSSTVLWEYFCVDVRAQMEEFEKHLDGKQVDMSRAGIERPPIAIVQDPRYGRCSCTIDYDLAEDILFHRDMEGCTLEEHIARARQDLANTLHWLNKQQKHKMEQDIFQEVIHNCMSIMRYEYLEPGGPRLEKITVDHPIVPGYFCHLDGDQRLAEVNVQDERESERVLAYTGWIMDGDPLSDFAAPGSEVYLRRQLIPWIDICKLHYGQRPDDSPWLWAHMAEYTRQMALIFHAFRIDNCNSTPLHVGEYLLDQARLVRPDIYVVAELFTNSESIDNIFINRLGINSLIREAANAYDSKELGRLVYHYGGQPVASFVPSSGVQPLKPSVARALFMDLTHDNECLMKSRSVYDTMANSALVAMACCASGSVRGYDELVPYMIGVVGGGRLYSTWSTASPTALPSPGTVNHASGVVKGKQVLNELHARLATEKYSQVYVDQVSESVVAVTRHNPETHDTVILIAHTAFQKMPEHEEPTEEFMGVSSYIPPLVVQGVVDKILLEGYMVRHTRSPLQDVPDRTATITGLADFKVEMATDIAVCESHFCELRMTKLADEVHFHTFPPGAVIAFQTRLSDGAKSALKVIHEDLSAMANGDGSIAGLMNQLSLTDLNTLLYRCDAEEQDDGNGSGVYHVPGHSPFKYCGLQGVQSSMEIVFRNNDLGHALCDNLRAGDWLVEYICNRLKHHNGTRKVGEAMSEMFKPLSTLPRYLVPLYFQRMLSQVYRLARQQAITQMSPFVRDGSEFIQSLALGSVQLYGVVKSSPMRVASSSVLDDQGASLAAGLPHFATVFMRCWGRDTFIALPGLMMVTGRLEVAKKVILAFAACLRHGLIPNLYGSGSGARFNCRDASWWFLQAIQDYCRTTGDVKILGEHLNRLFPTDDSVLPTDDSTPLFEIVQEILQRHANGISFREQNAGPSIGLNTVDDGFNVTAGIDWNTGFPYGGSASDCGTWMDKVGESDLAYNRGVPATPRDGSAVEIVGLCKSTVAWLAKLHASGDFPYAGVNVAEGNTTTYAEWDAMLKKNFEQRFWIPVTSGSDVQREGCDAKYIHRRGIYKDTVGAAQRFADFQLRPNFPIAMVVAPNLFTPGNAAIALQNAQDILGGPQGMATLDPNSCIRMFMHTSVHACVCSCVCPCRDWAYNGIYSNGTDSFDYGSARGFNYHQGPEWLWIKGFFLRARYRFASASPSAESVVASVRSAVARLQDALEDSEWQGLAELTNAAGAECIDSCPVQAWSMSCLLELLRDMAD
ncbi:glycogen debranching enzyme-like isoform X3 [Sycon ciliatum]|uniref:glycogen debranching enzyme-like isoform X3 n=1 Tax=Sycon ciliatum TaxID=27933 RepID=UPI0031F6D792